MKKLLITLLLAVFSTSAIAAWIVFNEHDNYINYVDPATIRKSGTLVKMWSMADFKKVQKLGQYRYLSIKAQSEYDCRNETTALLSIVYYSGNRGGGVPVYSASYGDMSTKPVVPESMGETEWKIACGK